MNISQNTLSLLKHLSIINPGINIQAGNEVMSKAIIGNMMVYATIDETFPEQFITSDLIKFLSVSSLFDNPEYDFNTEYVEIMNADNTQKSIFYYGYPESVQQDNKMPKEQPITAYKFILTDDVLAKIFKSSSAIDANDIVISGNENILNIKICNTKIKTGNTFNFNVGNYTCDEETKEKNLQFIIDRKSLKLISGIDYEVTISDTGLAVFDAINSPYSKLTFFVATTIN